MSRTTKSGMNIEYLATDSPSNGAKVKAIASTYTMAVEDQALGQVR